MMLKEKIWYLVQDCNEWETSLLIYSIEGIKEGAKGISARQQEVRIQTGEEKGNVIKRKGGSSII